MPLTKEQANAIYTVLVEFAGACANDRDQFVIVECNTECMEYRFSGFLGFGGKFWITPRGWDVNCYPEDMNDIRSVLIERTNEALAELHAQLT